MIWGFLTITLLGFFLEIYRMKILICFYTLNCTYDSWVESFVFLPKLMWGFQGSVSP
jgi:hypothetical protein